MITINGRGVFKGIAIGKISLYKKADSQVKRYKIDNFENEITRFNKIKETASNELQSLYEKAFQEVGEANAMIFEIHKMMLDDLDYIDSIENIIKNQLVNCEYAIATTCNNFAHMFENMDDEYMKARAADVHDISERLLNVASGNTESNFTSSIPVIIVARDLAPSETVQLDKSLVLGFVTELGSANSHTAILARTMNIPAIINADDITNEEYNGKDAIIDGFTGNIYIEPDQATIDIMTKKKAELEEKAKLLEKLKGQKTVTKDGKEIKLYANIGGVNDLGLVLQNDAGGIGLFRSEFLYLENNTFPSEEEQFSAYKKVAESMAGKQVIIRTLDIGADKQVDYFNLGEEENPALGFRAIRICLEDTNVFKTQLRALYRATAFGDIAIMFPMIISVEEVLKIKKIAEEVREELSTQNIEFNENTLLGIMIETPAAAIISDDLAKEVDFFSIGTNDLSQYTLAIDRQNQKLEPFFDPHHKAILKLIKMVVENGRKNGIWTGICGELGADLELTEFFLKIGVAELSVSPGVILSVKDKILNTNISELKDFDI